MKLQNWCGAIAAVGIGFVASTTDATASTYYITDSDSSGGLVWSLEGTFEYDADSDSFGESAYTLTIDGLTETGAFRKLSFDGQTFSGTFKAKSLAFGVSLIPADCSFLDCDIDSMFEYYFSGENGSWIAEIDYKAENFDGDDVAKGDVKFRTQRSNPIIQTTPPDPSASPIQEVRGAGHLIARGRHSSGFHPIGLVE